MKKWLFLLLIFGTVAAFNGGMSLGTDVAELAPVQSVRVAQFNRYIMVETDTGAWGMGGDLASALVHMEETSPASVFLDTADYLIVAPELLYLLPDLKEVLRPSCGICLERGKTDMERVGQFLQIHEPKITLSDYLAGITDLPTLLTTQEGMQLVQ